MRHTQIFIRAEVKAPLLTIERANKFMRQAVAAAGMNIISGPHSVMGIIPGNEGVSSVVTLDFSSASLHEWPDAAPFPLIHFDLYTCGARPDLARFAALFEALGPVRYKARLIDRDDFLNDN